MAAVAAMAGDATSSGADDVRTRLAVKLAQIAGFDGDGVTAIPGLFLFCRKESTLPGAHVYEPSLGIILQGRKHVAVGDERFSYDPSCFFLTAVDVPVVSYIAEASEARPFIAMAVKLDLAKIRQWILEYDIPAPPVATNGRAMGTGAMTAVLLQAFSRLVDLLEVPEDIPVLSDALMREIVYRLLKSEQGGRLWQIAMSGGQSKRIQTVIAWLKRHYAQPLHVEELANMAAMSVSSLHLHFRNMTSMSPLQFQKQLRLQEARRIMLVDGLDAALAGARVGYDSPSQFSREYARMYGRPPARDIRQLRASYHVLSAEPAQPAYRS
jgi:AraC-like DNA-binding protein